ncbi:ATP synthase subunit e, mitochondrial [Wickerhamomyces ciferrii]|uniref:ATP synthase F(0) complex subunit e, mitochondrial n=1 Tax=Wickerhamomyces ciferrii (strain ATCC 14091 / BCRC 22168 / CBS 111 / JCM 3599 / NBRC 0793 / NRRL Y-1031 F-60-10) TaxID=1206466 RepID=K0KLZ5_WICCF|nr:ATP synthase subunit e, mitochondrial [Wickerhamomyces ciferrii]CCH42148.1 ATP synthase subunit e, mitochondrial [Wickerhamomyces ciferrii]
MSTVNVFRYSALAAGVLYGAYHTYSLESTAKKAEAQRLFAKKEALILEAKAKFAELNAPKKVETPKTQSKEINLDDDKLDFAQVIISAVESLETAKN